jgi:hypothetical protein
VLLDGLKQVSGSTAVRYRLKFEIMPDAHCYTKGETKAGWESRGGEASKGDTHRSFKQVPCSPRNLREAVLYDFERIESATPTEARAFDDLSMTSAVFHRFPD